jgi:hypothetical protein
VLLVSLFLPQVASAQRLSFYETRSIALSREHVAAGGLRACSGTPDFPATSIATECDGGQSSPREGA